MITCLIPQDKNVVSIGRVGYRAMVIYQNHHYIKINVGKVGEGIYINHPRDSCLLLNPKYGSIRAIHEDTEVTLANTVQNPVQIYKITEEAERREALLY